MEGLHGGYDPELRQKVEGERQKRFKVALFPSHGRLLLLYKHYKGHQNLNGEALLLSLSVFTPSELDQR